MKTPAEAFLDGIDAKAPEEQLLGGALQINIWCCAAVAAVRVIVVKTAPPQAGAGAGRRWNPGSSGGV
jgi:hypothetical protein